MLSNDQPLGNAGFEAVGAVALIDLPEDPLTLDPLSPSAQDLTKYVGQSASHPPLEDVLSWTDQLLEAIHQLHTQPRPVVHGGISPSSVTLAGEKITLGTPDTDAAGDANVNFKPLEQIWDGLDHVSKRVILNQLDDKAQNSIHQPLSPASDIYSVGATVYAILTGQAPPDALDRTIVVMEGKADPLRHPSELSPSVAAEIGDAIVRAMSLRREDRPFSAVILRQIFRTASVKVQERLASAPAPEPILEIDVLPADVAVVEVEPQAVQTDSDEENARQLALRILAEKSAANTVEVPIEVEAISEDLYVAEPDDEPVIDEVSVAVVDDPPAAASLPSDEPYMMLPVVENAAAHRSEPAPFSDHSLNAAKSGSKGMMIGVAAAVFAVVGIAGFFIFSGSSTPKAQPAPQQVEQSSVPSSSDAVPAQSAENLPVAAQTDESAPAPGTETLDAGPAGRTHNVAAPAQLDKTKKPAPATPAKPAPAKKQVTVDDLINDH